MIHVICKLHVLMILCYVCLESVVCWINPEGTMNVKQFVKSQMKFQIEWKNTCMCKFITACTIIIN